MKNKNIKWNEIFHCTKLNNINIIYFYTVLYFQCSGLIKHSFLHLHFYIL